MTPLLLQFLSETRDLLQGISEKLLDVEKAGDRSDTLNELFRLVHTLKGNTGLFEFPDLTRILHAGEDVMSEKREAPEHWDQGLTDVLFEAMDYISQFCDSIEETDGEPVSDSRLAQELADRLRAYMAPASSDAAGSDSDTNTSAPQKSDAQSSTKKPAKKTAGRKKSASSKRSRAPALPDYIPESDDTTREWSEQRLQLAFDSCQHLDDVVLISYEPVAECFFQGDDPFFFVQKAPGLIWGAIDSDCAKTDLSELDPYQCVTRFVMICDADTAELEDYFRYVPDQVTYTNLDPMQLLTLSGRGKKDAVPENQVEAICQSIEEGATVSALCQTALELIAPGLTVASALRWLLWLEQSNASKTARIHIAQRLRQTQYLSPYEFSEGSETDDATPATETPSAGSVPESPSLLVGLELEDREALTDLLVLQQRIIRMDDGCDWSLGRIKAATNVIRNCCTSLNRDELLQQIEPYLDAADHGNTQDVLTWLDQQLAPVDASDFTPAPAENEHSEPTNQTVVSYNQPKTQPETAKESQTSSVSASAPGSESGNDPVSESGTVSESPDDTAPPTGAQPVSQPATTKASEREETSSKPGSGTSRSVKVDQEKIDRLMNLIGEMTVAKNALPFLARRAEERYGLRDLAREIKEEYAVVNRIAEEMQDAIMQIRMMPFSFISMRFPRLVRDISRRLNKDVQLVIEGEDTEADKNIIESLAEPLIHIVRNSLDHGIEAPDVRTKSGKPAAGVLTIRASQEADRVLIEIKDDGKGIDPDIVRKKALEKGLIDEATAQRMSDREAINLVLLPGFSTAEAVSDLSGRGVGMDAVRSAVDKVNGAMSIDSEPGKGTHTRISLPLSISVSRVMIVESDGQQMGIPMDQVLETVRVPQNDIHIVKNIKTTVLRDRILPLKSLNHLLSLPADQKINEDNEFAVLITRVGSDVIGLVVDDFRGSADIIQKPMQGVLSGLNAYSGAALIGDGSVLMVLNLKEIL